MCTVVRQLEEFAPISVIHSTQDFPNGTVIDFIRYALPFALLTMKLYDIRNTGC